MDGLAVNKGSVVGGRNGLIYVEGKRKGEEPENIKASINACQKRKYIAQFFFFVGGYFSDPNVLEERASDVCIIILI